MAQAHFTTCAHNATGQVLVAGVPTACRKCGALIEPSPRSCVGATVVGEAVNAVYPGDGNTADQSWAFGQ